jgi:hypothetical protein
MTMTRRSLVSRAISTVLGIFGLTHSANGQSAASPESGRKYEKQGIKELFNSDGTNISVFDFTSFPFEHVQTDGRTALAEFEKLKSTGRGIPVIVGRDDDVDHIVEGWDNRTPPKVDQILKKAEALGSHFDIKAMRKKEFDDLKAEMKAQGNDIDDIDFVSDVNDGTWPDNPFVLNAPTITNDPLSESPLERVFIILVPAQSSFEIPAYVGWGNWNSNPPADVHVAMLRKWHELYGAELVGMTGDVLNVRVKKRPQTREEALALAEEMYHYCADIVEQGTETTSALAASLMVSDYWYFWWD